MIWCDVMWCDVMWCDVMWFNTISYMMWCDVMCCDMISCMMWCDVNYMVWFVTNDMIWYVKWILICDDADDHGSNRIVSVSRLGGTSSSHPSSGPILCKEPSFSVKVPSLLLPSMMLHILIVEDSLSILKVVCQMLKQKGNALLCCIRYSAIRYLVY